MAIEIAKPQLLLRQLFDRDTYTYTYLLVDPETRQGAIIDAVKEQFDRDLEIIKELGVELLYAIETHAHADHITSAGMLRQNTGAKIVFGEAAGIQEIDLAVKDGDELSRWSWSCPCSHDPGIRWFLLAG